MSLFDKIGNQPTIQEIRTLFNDTCNSYLFHYTMVSYDKTQDFIKLICDEFHSQIIGCFGPEKLLRDLLSFMMQKALHMGSGRILSRDFKILDSPAIPRPSIAILFGPFLGEFHKIADMFHLQLKSHELRIVIYLEYANAPINKMIVF